jgi:hypothetical protein
VAYGKLNEPSGLDELSKLTGIGRTGISDNNSFLASIGIIEGGKKKFPTPRGAELARALEHDISEEISKVWASIVQESEFLNKILQAVGIRRGMETSQLETHIAYSAGEPKNDAVMTGSRAVIDILRTSGLVIEEDGQIKPKYSFVTATTTTSATTTTTLPPYSGPRVSSKTNLIEVSQVNQDKLLSPFSFHIEVRINATPSDLDGLGEKIRALISSLETPKNHDPDSEGN